MLKKNGFQVVENRQKRVSGSGKPGMETLHPSETIISVGNIKKQHAYFCLNVSVTQNDWVLQSGQKYSDKINMAAAYALMFLHRLCRSFFLNRFVCCLEYTMFVLIREGRAETGKTKHALHSTLTACTLTVVRPSKYDLALISYKFYPSIFVTLRQSHLWT